MLALLGFLDLLSAIVIVLLRFFNVCLLGWIVVVYLIIKAIVFFSPISLLDLVSAIIIIFAIYGSFSFITWLAFVWLIQKAFFSFY